MKTNVGHKFNALNTENGWQYGPSEQILSRKREYDTNMANQKLLNTVINKVDPVSGERFTNSLALQGASERLESDTGQTHDKTISPKTIKNNAESNSIIPASRLSVSPQKNKALSPNKLHYEPHLIKGEYKEIRGKKEFQIRGVFRMDPQFDPDCKAFGYNKRPKSTLAMQITDQ